MARMSSVVSFFVLPFLFFFFHVRLYIGGLRLLSFASSLLLRMLFQTFRGPVRAPTAGLARSWVCLFFAFLFFSFLFSFRFPFPFLSVHVHFLR